MGHRARQVLGDDARSLAREGPLTSGSNAWAVGGARTASGLPLVGGDPTGRLSRPASTPAGAADLRRAGRHGGSRLRGVPGVQHFGHAGDVAWAITNAMADYEDVYAETLRRTAGGWRRSARTVGSRPRREMAGSGPDGDRCSRDPSRRAAA